MEEEHQTTVVGNKGQWEMQGFESYPPTNAYDITYKYSVFHYYNGKESAGGVYNITPDLTTLKKYGILKLAKKPAVFVDPVRMTRLVSLPKGHGWIAEDELFNQFAAYSHALLRRQIKSTTIKNIL